jgi:hypothetical protein
VGGRTGGRVVVLEKWVTAKEGTAEERGARSSRRGRRDRRVRREGPRDRVHTADYAYTGRGGEEGDEDEGEGELRTGRPPLSTSGTLWERRKASYAMQQAAAEARRRLSGRCRDALLGWRWDGAGMALTGMAAGWALLWAGLLGCQGCWGGATLAVRRAAITRTTATQPP